MAQPRDKWAFLHPTGNTYSRSAVEKLAQADKLDTFWTTIAWQTNTLTQHLPPSLLAQLERRTFADTVKAKTRTPPNREWLRLLAIKMKWQSLTQPESGYASVEKVFAQLDRELAIYLSRNASKSLFGVYCCEDAALNSFRQAKQLGLKTAYDLPIAYWALRKQIYEEEAERLPEWQVTLKGHQDSDEKLARKAEELELADVVFCPSPFVANSLPPECRQKKQVTITPFGSPEIMLEPQKKETTRAPNSKLRILFAGSMSQRKGLADLLKAMRLLNRSDCQLTLLGSLQTDEAFYRKAYSDFTYIAPCPRKEVLRIMQAHDIFILPSLVEGRALVVQEAMACGLPVIITANTGCEDVVEEESTGFVIPIRSPETIAEKIHWFADNRSMLPDMREAAKNKAATISWKQYQETILNALIDLEAFATE